MELENRFVIPPMASDLANEDGTVTQALIDYWATRAKGGWGLLIVEFTAIDPLGKVGPCHPCLWSDKHIKGLHDLTDAVHQDGAKIAIQLSHTGRQTTHNIIGIQGARPVSASPIPCPLDREIPRELTVEEVYELVEKFGDAALRAREAGFDAVEIHGAHGYLLAQFMSSYSNKRTDKFGGNLQNRMRFPISVINNIRQKIGPDFPLLFRMSGEERIPGGRTLDESRVVARMIEDAGIDAIDVSIGVGGSQQLIIAPAVMPPGYQLTLSGEIKKSVSVPVIAVGRITDPIMAEDAILTGKADLIAWGRSSLADPDLPRKVSQDKIDDICPCIGCIQGCIRSFPFPDKPLAKLGITCLVNPFCGRENELKIEAADKKKKITVIGGGPGGLEAAWIAAARGHSVTLYEKDQKLGGQYRIAAIPPFKQDIAKAVNYYVHMCKKHGVEIKTGTEATADLIISGKPDAVIIATGSEPVIPDEKWLRDERVVLVSDILEGKKQTGSRVLIAGGGMIGCEVADFLGEHLHDVTVIEMLPEIGGDMPLSSKYFLLKRFEEYCIRVENETKMISLTDTGVTVEKNGKHINLEGFDTIVLALGNRSVNLLEKQLEDKVPELHVIGDALAPRMAIHAIEEGARVAVGI